MPAADFFLTPGFSTSDVDFKKPGQDSSCRSWDGMFAQLPVRCKVVNIEYIDDPEAPEGRKGSTRWDFEETWSDWYELYDYCKYIYIYIVC